MLMFVRMCQARKKWDSEAPLREAARKEQERADWFNSLPAWKQKLVLDKERA